LHSHRAIASAGRPDKHVPSRSKGEAHPIRHPG
jgi:hypothetical protein